MCSSYRFNVSIQTSHNNLKTKKCTMPLTLIVIFQENCNYKRAGGNIYHQFTLQGISPHDNHTRNHHYHQCQPILCSLQDKGLSQTYPAYPVQHKPISCLQTLSSPYLIFVGLGCIFHPLMSTLQHSLPFIKYNNTITMFASSRKRA